jgi:hypothetical protein
LDEAHPLVADPFRRDGQHLRGGVDRGDLAGVPEQLAGPHARAAGKLERTARRPERLERCAQFVAAAQVQAVVQVVSAQGMVVGALLIEQPADVTTVGCAHAPPRWAVLR